MKIYTNNPCFFKKTAVERKSSMEKLFWKIGPKFFYKETPVQLFHCEFYKFFTNTCERLFLKN